jgi:hypothetical protein
MSLFRYLIFLLVALFVLSTTLAQSPFDNNNDEVDELEELMDFASGRDLRSKKPICNKVRREEQCVLAQIILGNYYTTTIIDKTNARTYVLTYHPIISLKDAFLARAIPNVRYIYIYMFNYQLTRNLT